MRSHSIRSLWLWALASFTPVAQGQSLAPTPRQVVAPASDIVAGIVRLPDPAAAATNSRVAIVPLEFSRAADSSWSARVELAIDRGGDVALALLSPDAGAWRVTIPSGTSQRRVAWVGDDMPGWVVARYDVRGVATGRWSLRIDAPLAARPPAEGWLLLRTASELELEAYVATHQRLAGEPIRVVARIDDERAHVTNASVLVDAGGRTQRFEMSGDRVLETWIALESPGTVRARVECTGRTSDGAEFARSAPLSFSVVERAVAIAGNARADFVADGRLRIGISALPLSARSRFHVSAEVWGSATDGTRVPVCWLSRIVEPAMQGGLWTLPLDLDVRWIDVARAHAPLELRHVRVQDPDTATVFDLVESLALDAPALPPPSALTLPPPLLAPLVAEPKPRVPSLMLVHGYCSSGNIWPAADFTQPKTVFLDPNANRTHDAFAQLIYQKALQSGVNSFGVVAHSQGGAAALHLLTYYHSGLDFSVGGRRIQSVATPYQGTPLASLGFFACGVNNNMTPGGAATWLAGIPSWARAEVSFWTTSNSGSACQFLTDILLSNPEDGTVEQFRGQLPGGNGMGHTNGWCHTTGMSNPANYTDHARNQAMDAAAAR